MCTPRSVKASAWSGEANITTPLSRPLSAHQRPWVRRASPFGWPEPRRTLTRPARLHHLLICRDGEYSGAHWRVAGPWGRNALHRLGHEARSRQGREMQTENGSAVRLPTD